MSQRLPSRPPIIPGFSFVHILGAGGFADVFLYEQNMPRRQVAVKVLLSEVVNEGVRQMFQAEANLMASLSSHPSILTVHQASVASDGRPYIVTEVCSSALAQRYRRERIPVPEVLRIAIRVASAVETAHRAGILHRDIKPTNILLTAYGHPVLADFGIASTLGALVNDDSVGLSIPWSSPEVLLDETPGSIGSEVWSLAATVYSLLAGRSPFEIEGEENSSSDLVSRITRARFAPIERDDLPASLERILRTAMARRERDRHSTVFEFIEELREVEDELGVPPTPVEVAMDDWARSSVVDLEERTQLRSSSAAQALSVAERRLRRRERAARGDAPSPTTERSRSVGSRASSSRRTRSARTNVAVTALLALCAILAGGIVVLTIALFAARGSTATIPTVEVLDGEAGTNSVEFSWSDPGTLEGDRYQITAGDGSSAVQRETRFAVAGAPGEEICITVRVNRDGRTGDPSPERCLSVLPD